MDVGFSDPAGVQASAGASARAGVAARATNTSDKAKHFIGSGLVTKILRKAHTPRRFLTPRSALRPARLSAGGGMCRDGAARERPVNFNSSRRFADGQTQLAARRDS